MQGDLQFQNNRTSVLIGAVALDSCPSNAINGDGNAEQRVFQPRSCRDRSMRTWDMQFGRSDGNQLEFHRGSTGCCRRDLRIYVNNNDLTLTAPSASDANQFLTFAAHPNLVFSINWPPGPGSANTNCATANSNGLSCSVFAGSPGVLTYQNGQTVVSLGVQGRASDTGVAGLATGSNYTGGFSQTFTATLPNGMAPTPQNIQLYFCPSGTCTAADFASGRSLTSSQSASFTVVATVPESATISLALLGGLLVAIGSLRRNRR